MSLLKDIGQFFGNQQDLLRRRLVIAWTGKQPARQHE
jgi:hypothetical protein